MMPAVDFSLYLITDRNALPTGKTMLEQVESALEGGVRAVHLREKDLDASALFSLAKDLRALTRAYRARLLINDRIDVALAVGADGVHLGGHSLPTAEARTLLGPERLIGVSTHHPDEIPAAARDGADFVTFGPVYHTPSKLPYGDPVGLDRLREACNAAHLPVFALGGITPSRIPEILATGCTRIACIRAIFYSDLPSDVTSLFLENLSHR